MRRAGVLVGSALLLAASSLIVVAIAGAERVAFPAYQTHVLYGVLDQPELKEIRELYVTREALKALKAGQPLPSGMVLSAPTFKARLDEKGELLKDANGRLIRGSLHRIVVMEKRTGWGAAYPVDHRNGDWEYALFEPNGAARANVKYTECFQCHMPKAAQDFVFSHTQLLKAAQ